MKNFLLIFLLIFFSCHSKKDSERRTLNVLFIGNSLTYWNGMPQILQRMLANETYSVNIEQSTFPGMTLSSHLNNIIISQTGDGIKTRLKLSDEITETEKKICQKKWDIVVLQEGTVRLLIPEAKDYLVNPAINQIKKLVNNPECKFLLFSTWPSKGDYPRQYCNPSSLIDDSIEKEESCSIQIVSLAQEVDLINKGFTDVANSNELHVTDNVNRFHEILKNHSEIDFYEDEIHPTKEGAYLNAIIFYKYISGKKATSITFDSDLPKATTSILKNVADLEI